MADKNYVSTAMVLFDAVYIPGGSESINALKSQGEALHFVNEAFKHCKPIAAMSEGINLLKESSIRGFDIATRDKSGHVVSDKGVVTVYGPADIGVFSGEFVSAIAKHRHWDRETKEQVPA
jgi:catalase